MKKYVIIIIVLLWMSPCWATTYYLQPAASGGNDADDGLSEANAWATWDHANSSVSPGDTVIVMDGEWATGGTNIHLTTKGTAGNLITYVAQNQGQAKISGPTTSGDEQLFILGTYSGGWVEYEEFYTVIDGIEFQGGRINALAITGAGYVTIQNCVLHGSGRDVIKNNSGADHNTIKNCEIYDSGQYDLSENCNNPGDELCNSDGIDVTSSDYMTIQDNYIHDILSWGVYIKKGSQHGVIERNLIESVYEGGIGLGESSPAYTLVAKNNLIYDTYMTCLQFSGCKDCQFYHNSCEQVSTNGSSTWAWLRVTHADNRNGCKITVSYTSGGTAEIVVGDVITGATSSDECMVETISLDSGTWAGGNAAGSIICREQFDDGVYNPFQSGAENLNVSGKQDNIATTTGNASVDDKYSANVTAKNNIFSANEANDYAIIISTTAFTVDLGGWGNFTSDYNIYYGAGDTPKFLWKGAGSTGLAAWRTYTNGLGYEIDTNSISVNPSFVSVNPLSSDFLKIPSGSDAVDNGTDVSITTDYAQAARDASPDIGAYEYIGAGTPPTVSGMSGGGVSFQ